MMVLDLYQIDAFTDKVFGGNPACVVPLEKWLPDEVLLQIARENAVAETAFFIVGSNKIRLRWFTPDIEMDLCGHATLATAHCLKTLRQFEKNEIVFDTMSGDLTVATEGDHYQLSLPSRPPVPSTLPPNIAASLSLQPKEVLKARDYVLLYESQGDIENIKIDRSKFDELNIDPGGVIITAPGEKCDFVSRFFTPQASIMEDPVTGSAHCSLVPYWANRLGKKDLLALQLSKRQGKLICVDQGAHVLLTGNAVTYAIGKILI